jgi:hypothetical protein
MGNDMAGARKFFCGTHNPLEILTDVFVYKVALSGSERQGLEPLLTTKFVAPAPAVAASGGAGLYEALMAPVVETLAPCLAP